MIADDTDWVSSDAAKPAFASPGCLDAVLCTCSELDVIGVAATTPDNAPPVVLKTGAEVAVATTAAATVAFAGYIASS